MSGYMSCATGLMCTWHGARHCCAPQQGKDQESMQTDCRGAEGRVSTFLLSQYCPHVRIPLY
jgi:hypothetical protein